MKRLKAFKRLILTIILFISISLQSQNIIGVGIGKNVDISIGNLHNNIYYSTDLCFPIINDIRWFNMGVGTSYKGNILSFKIGLYQNDKNPPLIPQIGGEWIKRYNKLYVGIGYLTEQKLTIKLGYEL